MNVFPTKREKIYTNLILSFFLGIIISVINIDNSMELKDYISPLSTLIAAFLGASFAFKLSNDKEIRREKLKNKEALNFALFTISRQKNAILGYKIKLDEYTSDFDLSFKFPALKNAEYDDLRFNFNDLGFILESNPNILMALSIEQERFEQAMTSIKIRNEFYVNEFQPILSEKGLIEKKVELETFQRELGERIFSGCLNGAETMKYHIISCNESIPEMHDQLIEFSKAMFPNEKFVIWSDKV